MTTASATTQAAQEPRVAFKYQVGDSAWIKYRDEWEQVQILQRRIHPGSREPYYRTDLYSNGHVCHQDTLSS